jgi:hypothetical protein
MANIVGAALLGGFVCVSSIAAGEIPPEVRQALQRNAQGLSPIRVSWTQQLGSELSIQEWLKKVNLEAFYVDEFSPQEVTYAWQDGMWHSHLSETKVELTRGIFVDKKTGEVRAKPGFDFSQLPRRAVFTEVACNRQCISSGNGSKGGSARLSIDSVDTPKWFPRKCRLFNPAYFREAGFVLPSSIATQHEGVKSLPLALIASGAQVAKVQETTLDGRRCLMVELEDKERNTRFYLDPACAYAVFRREERTRSGQLTAVSTMSDFVPCRDPKLWLPKRCEVAYYTWQTVPDMITEKPLAKRTFAVRAIDRRPIPLEHFSLKYDTPGTLVIDSTLPQARQMPDGVLRYVVPVDPDDLEAVIQAAADRKPFIPKGLAVSKTTSPVTLASLAADQRDLIQSMATASVKGRTAPVRVALFDNETSGSNPGQILPRLFPSDSEGVLKVVTSADIRAGTLDGFDVIVFPGGSGKQQAAAIQDQGYQAVREFVRRGGGYLGICAGSWLATCKPSGTLALVNAKANGSIEFGWVKMELTEVGQSILGQFAGLPVAEYGGGPIFSPAHERDLPDYVPLAFYRTEASQSSVPTKRVLTDTPAIVAARFGKGRVLLFSVHPEGVRQLDSLLKRAVLSVACDERAK